MVYPTAYVAYAARNRGAFTASVNGKAPGRGGAGHRGQPAQFDRGGAAGSRRTWSADPALVCASWSWSPTVATSSIPRATPRATSRRSGARSAGGGHAAGGGVPGSPTPIAAQSDIEPRDFRRRRRRRDAHARSAAGSRERARVARVGASRTCCAWCAIDAVLDLAHPFGGSHQSCPSASTSAGGQRLGADMGAVSIGTRASLRSVRFWRWSGWLALVAGAADRVHAPSPRQVAHGQERVRRRDRCRQRIDLIRRGASSPARGRRADAKLREPSALADRLPTRIRRSSPIRVFGTSSHAPGRRWYAGDPRIIVYERSPSISPMLDDRFGGGAGRCAVSNRTLPDQGGGDGGGGRVGAADEGRAAFATGATGASISSTGAMNGAASSSHPALGYAARRAAPSSRSGDTPCTRVAATLGVVVGWLVRAGGSVGLAARPCGSPRRRTVTALIGLCARVAARFASCRRITRSPAEHAEVTLEAGASSSDHAARVAPVTVEGLRGRQAHTC